MLVLQILLMVVIRFGLCDNNLVIPTAGFARLTSTVVLYKLNVRGRLERNVKDIITSPVNSYKEVVRVIEKHRDIAEVFDLPQPLSLELVGSFSSGSIQGPVRSVYRGFDDPFQKISVLFYAENIKEVDTLPDSFQPDEEWDSKFWVRRTTHYIKELFKGSTLVLFVEFSPNKQEDFDDISKRIKQIVTQSSREGHPIKSFETIVNELGDELEFNVMTSIKGDPPKNSPCELLAFKGILQWKECLKMLKFFQPTTIKLGLRPLMDFNTSKEEFILTHQLSEMSPYMDKVEEMYNDVDLTYNSIRDFLTYRESGQEGEIKERRILPLNDKVYATRYSLLSKIGFDIKRGSEQYLPAFEIYRYRVGYFKAVWKELLFSKFSTVKEKGRREKDLEERLEKLGRVTAEVSEEKRDRNAAITFDRLVSGNTSLYNAKTDEIIAPEDSLCLIEFTWQSRRSVHVRVFSGDQLLAVTRMRRGRTSSVTAYLAQGSRVRVVLPTKRPRRRYSLAFSWSVTYFGDLKQ